MSSSLLTNNSAMTALLSLNMTQQSLAKYENQVSTGLKIAQRGGQRPLIGPSRLR